MAKNLGFLASGSIPCAPTVSLMNWFHRNWLGRFGGNPAPPLVELPEPGEQSTLIVARYGLRERDCP